MQSIAEVSPRLTARLAGVFEAIEGVMSSYGQVLVLGRLVVSGSAAATAANVLSHQPLFWRGSITSLIGVACHVVWVVLFYEIFKPVNPRLSLLAAGVGFVVCAMQAVAATLYLAPLLVLQAGPSMTALSPGAVQDLAMIFFKVNAYAFNVDLVFFGLWCLLAGCLIFKSTFLPRVLGVLLAIDGMGWMMYVLPPFANRIFPAIATASAIAEIPLQLWLIFVGLNAQRWREQAGVDPRLA